MAVALNTFLAVKGNFNEATRIRQLEKLEETDLKLIGQLLSAYDEFCTLFEVNCIYELRISVHRHLGAGTFAFPSGNFFALLYW